MSRTGFRDAAFEPELVGALVRSGRFQNASEVLRPVERRETEDASRSAALRQAAQMGWDDVAAGRYVDVADEDLDDFVASLGARAGDR